MCGTCRKAIGGHCSSARWQHVASPIHVTPMTRDRVEAADWLARFEGAGLDGVMAKPENGTYEPGKRAMFKVKHARTADCVVAGFRWHKNGPGTLIGSLLLGLYDDCGRLHHVGVTSAFSMDVRRALASELEPLRDARTRRTSLARMGRRDGRRRNAHAWRTEPVERWQRSLVGAAANRASLRGQVRSHAGRSLSPCGDLSPLAIRQETH